MTTTLLSPTCDLQHHVLLPRQFDHSAIYIHEPRERQSGERGVGGPDRQAVETRGQEIAT